MPYEKAPRIVFRGDRTARIAHSRNSSSRQANEKSATITAAMTRQSGVIRQIVQRRTIQRSHHAKNAMSKDMRRTQRHAQHRAPVENIVNPRAPLVVSESIHQPQTQATEQKPTVNGARGVDQRQR